MAKFNVMFVWDCTESIEVEAETADEAQAIAGDKIEGHLCWHCSQHLELGDVIEAKVFDENGNEVAQ